MRLWPRRSTSIGRSRAFTSGPTPQAEYRLRAGLDSLEKLGEIAGSSPSIELRPKDGLDRQIHRAGRSGKRKHELAADQACKRPRLDGRSANLAIAERAKKLAKSGNDFVEERLDGLWRDIARGDPRPSRHEDDLHLTARGFTLDKRTNRRQVILHDLARDESMSCRLAKIHKTLTALVSLDGPSIADREDSESQRHRGGPVETGREVGMMRSLHRQHNSEAKAPRPSAHRSQTFLCGSLMLLAVELPACTDRPGAEQILLARGDVLLEGRSSSALVREADSLPSASQSQTAPPSGALANLPAKKLALSISGPVTGKYGLVTSVEAQATRVGALVLESGGNAIDAAVATALALAVTHPSAGNLGGGGFLLVRRGAEVAALDFREDAPANLTEKSFFRMLDQGAKTGAAVGVPGTVAGLLLAHQRFGRLPLGRVIIGAEKLARDGYSLGPRQAQTLIWSRSDLLRDAVARRVFFSGSEPHRAGVTIRRPDLALALQRIRLQGRKGFYEGPTADDIVKSLGSDGIMTKVDLARYEAKFRDPLWFDYRDYRIVTMPPPSGGGVALTQILRMLGSMPAAAEPSQFYHFFAEASRRAQLERLLFVRAPERDSAQEQTAQRARWLDPQTWLKRNPFLETQKTPSAELESAPGLDKQEEDHTTHLSVVDREGMAVSMTLTLSGSYGARVFSRETGIALNNSVASFSAVGRNRPEGGVRTVSSMAPTLIVDETDTLVLGSPGGDTIPSTVALLVLRLLDQGLDFQGAVEAPRVHQGLFPDVLEIERNRPVPFSVLQSLGRQGYQIGRKRSAQGDANIAAWLGGTCSGIADGREGGLALAARK